LAQLGELGSCDCRIESELSQQRVTEHSGPMDARGTAHDEPSAARDQLAQLAAHLPELGIACLVWHARSDEWNPDPGEIRTLCGVADLLRAFILGQRPRHAISGSTTSGAAIGHRTVEQVEACRPAPASDMPSIA
jgi:hypothetical protein